ncbi:MAG: CYTH domain-containing protein [Rhodospirillales bacterium]
MRREIERKFLVAGEGWRGRATGIPIRQGYLCSCEERSVRVRLAGGRGTLTVKGAMVGASRAEYEYDIPPEDANALLDALCERPLIEKTRYVVVEAGLAWEVDVFTGDNTGLIVAELELGDEAQRVDLPAWIGEEVTGDPRYLNANLFRNPFGRW